MWPWQAGQIQKCIQGHLGLAMRILATFLWWVAGRSSVSSVRGMALQRRAQRGDCC